MFKIQSLLTNNRERVIIQQSYLPAIYSIEQNNNQWFKIHINPGIYWETITIPISSPCIILEGSGSNATTIISSQRETTSDWGSTFSSFATNVIVSDITLKNSYNLEGGSDDIEQALSAAFYGDKSAIFNSSFMSYQDTLFAAKGRHYFKDCYVIFKVMSTLFLVLANLILR